MKWPEGVKDFESIDYVKNMSSITVSFSLDKIIRMSSRLESQSYGIS